MIFLIALASESVDLSDAKFKKREDWESYKIGFNPPELPPVTRDARQPGGPYFPVEGSRLETTTAPKGQVDPVGSGLPTTSEEGETGLNLLFSSPLKG